MIKPETFLLHRGGRTVQMVMRCEYDAVVAELKQVKSDRSESNRIKRAKWILGKVIESKISGYLHGKVIKAIRVFLDEE